MADFTIKQGATFTRVWRWESAVLAYKAITAIPQLSPIRFTVTGHGMPSGWRCAISDVGGMREINAVKEPPRQVDYHIGTVIDPNTIELNKVNAASYHAYTSGGVLRYFTPVDLTDYTARIDIKDRVGGTILVSLTTTDGDIVIDEAGYTITATLEPAVTEAITWNGGVFHLELEAPDGTVTRLDSGRVFVSDEVTTTGTP